MMRFLVLMGVLLACFTSARLHSNARHLTDCTGDCSTQTISHLERARAIMLRGETVVSVDCARAGSVLKARHFQHLVPHLGSSNDTGNGTSNGTTNGTSISAKDVLVAVCQANPANFVTTYCLLQCNKPVALPPVLLPPNLGAPPTSVAVARGLFASTGASPSLINCTCPYTLVGSPVYTDSQDCFCTIDFEGGNTSYAFFAPDLLIAPPLATIAPVGPPPGEMPAILVGDMTVMPLVNCSCAATEPYTPLPGGFTVATNCSCTAYFTPDSDMAPVKALVPSVVVYPGVLIQAVAPPKTAQRALMDVVGEV